MTDRQKDGIAYTSKCIFRASEEIREALDTLDLEDLPSSRKDLQFLNESQKRLEEIAQRFQKQAMRYESK